MKLLLSISYIASVSNSFCYAIRYNTQYLSEHHSIIAYNFSLRLDPLFVIATMGVWCGIHWVVNRLSGGLVWHPKGSGWSFCLTMV